MRALFLPAMFASLALGGCPADIDVEGRTFPCRSAGDCVDGYECHPTRYVCVTRGSADGGSALVTDSGTSGLTYEIGDPCSPVGSCDTGICVDGYCCESSCTDDCHRCDIVPGQCTPVQDGADPDNECEGREFDCSLYTYGLQGTSCFAANEGTASSGTCSGKGTCRPLGCQGPGVMISRCENNGCLREGACPVGALIADYDDPSEVCVTGTAATCSLTTGEDGCCSLLGACCPNATCTPDQFCE